MNEIEREFDPNDATELREFDDALHTALAAAREWHRGHRFMPDHPKLWLLISEYGEAAHARLRIIRGPHDSVTVQIRFVDRAEADPFAVDGLTLMRHEPR